MTGRSVASRKYFPWDNKSCGIGPKVLEEVDKTIEEYSGLLASTGRREFVEGGTYIRTFIYIFGYSFDHVPNVMKRMASAPKPPS